MFKRLQLGAKRCFGFALVPAIPAAMGSGVDGGAAADTRSMPALRVCKPSRSGTIIGRAPSRSLFGTRDWTTAPAAGHNGHRGGSGAHSLSAKSYGKSVVSLNDENIKDF